MKGPANLEATLNPKPGIIRTQESDDDERHDASRPCQASVVEGLRKYVIIGAIGLRFRIITGHKYTNPCLLRALSPQVDLELRYPTVSPTSPTGPHTRRGKGIVLQSPRAQRLAYNPKPFKEVFWACLVRVLRKPLNSCHARSLK